MTTLEIKTLDDSYLGEAFVAEGGPDVDFDAWVNVVTASNWLRYGIFKNDQFAGWVGIERISPQVAGLHVSVLHRTLTPKQTRAMMIRSGIALFDHGIEKLETCHLMTNRPACRLANSCGMSLDHLLIRNKLPHCIHSLTKQSYLDNPSRWDI